ncbi:MAG: hypothetical protein Q7U28_08090 [Aquabacterium sp.]|nr:hypothetical protein [Aquabacterium sp.]
MSAIPSTQRQAQQATPQQRHPEPQVFNDHVHFPQHHHPLRTTGLGQRPQHPGAAAGARLFQCGGRLDALATADTGRAAPHAPVPAKVQRQRPRAVPAGVARLELIRWLAAAGVALVLASAWLLDGPSEQQAMQDVAADLHDAVALATVTAQVRP